MLLPHFTNEVIEVLRFKIPKVVQDHALVRDKAYLNPKSMLMALKRK